MSRGYRDVDRFMAWLVLAGCFVLMCGFAGGAGAAIAAKKYEGRIVQEIRKMKPGNETIERLEKLKEEIMATGAPNATELAAEIDGIIKGAR